MNDRKRIHDGLGPAAGLCLLSLLMIWTPLLADDQQPLDWHLEQIRELNRSGNIARAAQLLEQTRIMLGQGTPEQQVEHRLLLGKNLGLRNQPERALAELGEFLSLEIDDLQRVRILAQSANLAAAGRLYQEAFAYLREALFLVDRIDHPGELSNVYGLAAMLLASAGEIEQAITYGARAVHQAELAQQPSMRCLSRKRLAIAWSSAGQPAQLERAIETAIEVCSQAEEPFAQTELARMRARWLLEQGQIERAEDAAFRAVELSRQLSQEQRQPLPELMLARVLAARGAHDEAVELAMQQLDRLDQMRLWEQLAQAHELIARRHELNGAFDLALENMNALIEARAKHIEQDRARRLAYLEIAYELGTREQEIALLREQGLAGELSEQALRQQARLRQLSYVAGMIFSGLLLVLLVRIRRERTHFRRLSRRDGLTQLLNHTHFFQATEAALARSAHQDLCLVLADIDHFKQINDRFGHLVGDEVLRRVGARLRECFPAPAILGRIGGEEFAIALPNCSVDDAIERIQELRARVNQARYGEEATHVTLSFGLASNQAGESLEALRERVDKALYRAKRAGRDCWVCADVESSSP